VSADAGTKRGEPTPLGTPATFDGGLVEVAPDTYAWIQPNGGLGESNAGLVVGDGESFLIDTLWDERLTARMLAAMEGTLAEAPITCLFNTHGDGDHWYGNGLLDAGVEIVASDPALKQMRAEPPSMLTRLSPVGSAAGLVGRVPLLPGRGRARGLGTFASMLSNYDFDGADPRLPVHTFTRSAVMQSGGRRVELKFVGPAHTIGDAIAWLPVAGVAFAGDILFNGITPIMWAGPVDNWIAALEHVASLEPKAVVGGHGPAGDVKDVLTLRDYWTWLAERVGEDPEADASKLAEELIRSDEFAAAPWGDWDGPERTLVNVARIATTSAGGDSEIGTVERLGLISAMGALAERVR
jgi:glyoxylase-like metal-dependent hydrolase (beta-lactamase superfamily II)